MRDAPTVVIRLDQVNGRQTKAVNDLSLAGRAEYARRRFCLRFYIYISDIHITAYICMYMPID